MLALGVLLTLSALAESVQPPMVEIPLAGPAASPTSELSGLAWHGSQLFLVAEEAQHGFYVLEHDAIDGVVSGRSKEPLTPATAAIANPSVVFGVPAFDGIEALTFVGDDAYIVVESRSPDHMEAYLLRGTLDTRTMQVTMDTTPPVAIGLSHQIDNMSVESILLYDGNLAVIEEVNGRNISPSPLAQVFSPALERHAPIPMANVEYRVTDATAPDREGRFWVTNYLWPPERYKVQPADDRNPDQPVEQLLELRIHDGAIGRTETPPIDLRANTPPSAKPRNWEGIARFDTRGFLLVTDAFPRTFFAFVPASAPD